MDRLIDELFVPLVWFGVPAAYFLWLFFRRLGEMSLFSRVAFWFLALAVLGFVLRMWALPAFL